MDSNYIFYTYKAWVQAFLSIFSGTSISKPYVS